MTKILIPAPTEPFTDPETGMVSEVWYRYLSTNTDAVNRSQPLEVKTASSTATLDFSLVSYSNFKGFRFTGQIVPASDNVTLIVRLATDATGLVFETGANDYCYVSSYTEATGLFGSTLDLTADHIRIIGDVGSATAEGVQFTLTILDVTNTGQFPKVSCYGVSDSATTPSHTYPFFSAGKRNNNQDATGVQFLFGSGDIESGTVSLYGI